LIFHYAINSAKTTTEKSVMIGDSLEADIEGALNIGLDAIFFNEFKVEVDQQIHQIFDLHSLKYYL
jgi:putative hydrolase of the HAD superfamily